MRKNAHTYVVQDADSDSVALDLSANFESKAINVKYLDNIGVDVSWLGSSPAGELFVEVSNSENEPVSADWRELDFGSAIGISGNSDNGLININQVPFNWVRFRYERVSGSGTMTIKTTMKQAG